MQSINKISCCLWIRMMNQVLAKESPEWFYCTLHINTSAFSLLSVFPVTLGVRRCLSTLGADMGFFCSKLPEVNSFCSDSFQTHWMFRYCRWNDILWLINDKLWFAAGQLFSADLSRSNVRRTAVQVVGCWRCLAVLFRRLTPRRRRE